MQQPYIFMAIAKHILELLIKFSKKKLFHLTNIKRNQGTC